MPNSENASASANALAMLVEALFYQAARPTSNCASANALAMLVEAYRELAGVLEATDPPPLRLVAVFEIAVRIEAGLEDPADDKTAFPFVIPPDAVLEDPAGYVERYVQEHQSALRESLQEWIARMRAWTPDMPGTPADDTLALLQGELTGRLERWQTALAGTLTGTDHELLILVRDAARLDVSLEAVRLIESAQDLQRKLREQQPDLPPVGDPPDTRLEIRRLQGLLRRLRKRTSPPAPDTYPVHTSQEWHALARSVADGQTQRNWSTDEQARELTHRVDGAPFCVKLQATQSESLVALRDLVQGLNADAIFGLLYISHLLAPADALRPGTYSGRRVYLDDVIDKIGLDPRSADERRQARYWIWTHVIQYGSRARVVGRRTGTYRDPQTGQEIDTRIDVSPWLVGNAERAVQPALTGFTDVPVSVELVATREWTALTTAPGTRQFLPCGEILGSLSRGQAAGAWARVIGLAYIDHVRRHPDGRIAPTRRELLTTFPPAKTDPIELLNSDHPARAVDYWRQALRLLVDRGILADAGEAAGHKRRPRGHRWQDDWLNETVDLQPGPLIEPALIEIAQTRQTRSLRGRRRRKNGG